MPPPPPQKPSFVAFHNGSITGEVAALLFLERDGGNILEAERPAVDEHELHFGVILGACSSAVACRKPAQTTTFAPFSAAAFMAS